MKVYEIEPDTGCNRCIEKDHNAVLAWIQGAEIDDVITIRVKGMSAEAYATILGRLEQGTMNAKGQGGWEGCPWAKLLKESNATKQGDSQGCTELRVRPPALIGREICYGFW